LQISIALIDPQNGANKQLTLALSPCSADPTSATKGLFGTTHLTMPAAHVWGAMYIYTG